MGNSMVPPYAYIGICGLSPYALDVGGQSREQRITHDETEVCVLSFCGAQKGFALLLAFLSILF